MAKRKAVLYAVERGYAEDYEMVAIFSRRVWCVLHGSDGRTGRINWTCGI